MIDERTRKAWLEALRSGKYKQGGLGLHDDITNKYCCLGVLADINGAEIGHAEYNYTFELSGNPNYGIPDEHQRALGEINDKGFSFRQIAKFIDSEEFNSWLHTSKDSMTLVDMAFDILEDMDETPQLDV